MADEQVRILECTQGKYDTAFRICGSPNEIPLLIENAKAGGFHLLEGWMNGAGAWPGYMVNQYYVEGGKNYADDTPEMAKEVRDLLRDKRFRQALSIGIDRTRMIDVAWNGIGEAKQATLSPQSWHFASAEGQEVYKAWAASYANFDAAAANALLDEVGMKKGADGMRTLPSGKPFILTMDISDWGGSLKVQTDAAAEAEKQWETNLGISGRGQEPAGPARPGYPHQQRLLHAARRAHLRDRHLDLPGLAVPDREPLLHAAGRQVVRQGQGHLRGGSQDPVRLRCEARGRQPGSEAAGAVREGPWLSRQAKRHEIVWEAIQVNIDEGPFIIGVSGDQPMPIIVKDYMRNILDYGVVGPWAPATPGNTVPAQWWMDK